MISWEKYKDYAGSGRYYPYRRRSHTAGYVFKIKKRRRDGKYILTVREEGHTDLAYRSYCKNPQAAKEAADRFLSRQTD